MTISASETPQDSGTSRLAKWAIALFFVALFIPGSVDIGIRMTPYRGYLMMMAVPMILQAVKDPALRVTSVDVLVFLSLLWQSATVLVLHKTEYLVYAGASFGEYFLGYMLGRVFIRKPSDFRYFLKCFLLTLLAFLPFALVELIGHRRILRELAGHVLTQSQAATTARERFGLWRVTVSFDTFLVYGAFCAVGFANVFYAYSNRFPRNLVYTAFVGFMTALAISTSSLITIFMQAVMITYDVMFRLIKYKWFLFVLFCIFPAIFLRVILDYVLTEVMFSPLSGQARSLHFAYGLQEILRHPILGVGMNRWATPYWLAQAPDNFWLALPLRNGIPALLLTATFFAVHFAKIARSDRLDEAESVLRTGYLISFASIMLGFFTFNFYGVTLVFFMMYCGGGAWFYAGQPPQRPARLALSPSPRRPLAGGRAARPVRVHSLRPR